MEFLHPPKGDKDHVILLLVTSERSKTYIRRYEWDSSAPVSTAVERGSGQRLSDAQRLPLLLIPLTMSAAFLLVFEDRVVTCVGILEGPARTHEVKLDHLEAPEEPGSSRARPLFTQWARVMRRKDHVSIQDNIYLCRDDGLVRFLDISAPHELRQMIDSTHPAGHLKANVNTAFASPDLGSQYPDLLVAGGEMSDGSLYTFAPRQYQPVMLIQKIANWTPTIDFATAQISDRSDRSDLRSASVEATGIQDDTQKRIFAPTGQGSAHGAVTEVRLGIEARLLPVLCETDRGVDQIWVLPDPAGGRTHILISYPTNTVSLSAGLEGSDQEEEDELRINAEARTLAAGITNDGHIVQITATSITVTKPGDIRDGLSINLENELIVKATILRSKRYGCLLLMVLRAAEELSLRWASVRTDGPEVSIQNLGEPQSLRDEPSCLSIHETEDELVALVGTLAGSLQLYAREGSSVQMHDVHTFKGDFAVCNSIAMVQDVDHCRLICGLRNGSMQTLLLAGLGARGGGQLSLIPDQDIVLGSTSVSVIIDDNNPRRAILACGKVFCAIEFGLSASANATRNNIWIAQQSVSAGGLEEFVPVFQPEVRIPDGGWGFADGHLFCVEGDRLCQIEISRASKPHMVPHRIDLDGTPSRIVHSTRLRRLIVLYTRTEIVRPPQRTGRQFRPGKRAQVPVLGFLKPDTLLSRPDPAGTANGRVLRETNTDRRVNVIPMRDDPEAADNVLRFCQPGEKFLGMMEWFPRDGSKEFHMLVVHTMIEYTGEKTPTGRLLFFQLNKNQTGNVIMIFKKAHDLQAPVFAVVPYGSSSLIYGCGKELYLHELELSERKWKTPTTFSLRSRGTHISAHAPFIFVTTASESLAVLRVEETEKDKRRTTKILFNYSDEVSRDGIFHLALPESGVILTSSKDCTVSALWMPPDRRISNCLSTIFAANFPGSVTRMRQLNRPVRLTRMLNKETVDGRRSDPILASTTDGTFYQMYLLNEPSWRLLRFIVNMAKRNPIICPYLDTYERRPRDAQRPHIEPSSDNKRHRHVDGDILARILDRGAEEMLEEMLDREPGDDFQVADFDDAAARRTRFQELVAEAGLEDESPAVVIEWIRELLMSAL